MNGLIGFDGTLSGSISDGGSGTTNYNDLSNKPSINSVPLVGNKTTADLHLFEGDYDDLDNRPAINGITLSGNKTTTDLGLFSGNYNDLTNKPTLFSGNYNDLTNKPTLFSGDYNDLTNKPTLFDGDYDSLRDRPSINDVILAGNKTTSDLGLFSGNYNDLTNKPTLFDGDYDGLTDKPQINGVTLAGNKTTSDLGLFSGDYNDLTNKPTLFSGDYNDLSNTPSIPDIDMLPAGSPSQTSTKMGLDNVIYELADADARTIIGDGQLDPDFTATDLTGACNELNSNLSNLKGVSIDDKTLTDLGQMAISQGCFSYYCQGTMTGTLTKNDSSYIGFGLFFYHKANQIPCYTLYCINSSKAYMGRLAKSGNDYVIDMVKVSTYTNVN